VLGTFLAKLRFGDPVQGLVNDADQFVSRGRVAGAHLMQQLGDGWVRFRADGIHYTLG
jgi:hypothetical protein